jgi:C4-dicarboxylate-specific signal transduction histidine kinase
MTEAGLTLPPAVLRRKVMCTTEEIAASLRHRVLGDLAGIGATLMTLRRRLGERHRAAVTDPEIRALLDDVDERVIAGGEHIPHRGLAPPDRDRGPIALGPAAAPLVEAVRACAGVEARWEDDHQQARIDPGDLQVALACVLENAVEAVQARGHGLIAIAAHGGGENETVVEIADDGEGLAPEAVRHGFDPFFSTRPEHLGLGLNVARRLARRWGGEISLSARSPHGVVVRLVLPRA